MLRSSDSRGEASETSAVEMMDGVSRDGRGNVSWGEVGWLPCSDASKATSFCLPLDFSAFVFSFFSAFSAFLASFSAAFSAARFAFSALSSSDFLPRLNMVKVAAAGLSAVGGVPGIGGYESRGAMCDADD